MSRAAARMKALQGFSFVVVRSGAPAYIDPNQTFSLSRLEGNYVSPDKAQGQVRVIGPGIVASIHFISIADQYWETNYLTGEWWACPPNQCFNPALLFDPQTGLQPILQSDVLDLKLLKNEELEELPGKLLYSLSGQVKGEHLAQVSYGLIGPDPLNVHLWVDPATFAVQRIQLEKPGANSAEATLWTVDFLNFDKVSPVLPPAIPTPTP